MSPRQHGSETESGEQKGETKDKGRKGRDLISLGYAISGIDQAGRFLSVFLFRQSGEIREQWSGPSEAAHIHMGSSGAVRVHVRVHEGCKSINEGICVQ